MRRLIVLAIPLLGLSLHCLAQTDRRPELNESRAVIRQNESLSAPRFLGEDGVGSDAEARAYYQVLGPQYVPGTYTLEEWVATNIGARPTHDGFYRNRTELGFWREMKCTQYVGSGLGGCMVRNWSAPDDPTQGKPNLGTVAMNVSSSGVTQFFVFAPSGKLSTAAVLDSEGEKFVPRVCTSCHSGSMTPPQTDVAAIFREFEPSELEAAPQRANASVEWFNLNQSVRSANQSIRTEAEGAAPGTDHARRSQSAYVRSVYPTPSASALSVRDAAHIPVTWRSRVGEAPRLVSAKARLWTQLVAPYCMTCHRTNSADWSEYDRFVPLGSLARGKTRLTEYLEAPETHRADFPYMPNAQLLYETMRGDASVEPAIQEWTSSLGDPSCATGARCVPREECRLGEIRSCDDPKDVCVATTPLPDGTSCGDSRTCSHGECFDSLTFSIPVVAPGIYVRRERPTSPEQHLRIVANHDLFVTQVSESGMCYLARTERVYSCNVSTLTCTHAPTADAFVAPLRGEPGLERRSPNPLASGHYRLESPVDMGPCP